MGKDNIYTILKLLDIYVAEELTEIFNLSLETGMYPTSWKISILKPLFKGGGKCGNDATSHRPVFLLTAASHIFEGILSNQMNNYAENSGILHPVVHGYRKGLSTVTALAS